MFWIMSNDYLNIAGCCLPLLRNIDSSKVRVMVAESAADAGTV
jgi:hypothetical protein